MVLPVAQWDGAMGGAATSVGKTKNTQRHLRGARPVKLRCARLQDEFDRLRFTHIDLLFLDGTPSEYLSYLRAAEPLLADGALVVADNTGVFAEGGCKGYLARVRGGGPFESSRSIATHLEWREDVPDAIEVSVYRRR